MLRQVVLMESNSFDIFRENNVQVFKDDETFPKLLQTVSTIAPPEVVAPNVKCPPAGTEVPFAKVITSGFAQDYEGCDVATVAQFVSLRTGEYYLGPNLAHPRFKGMVVFRVLPPGAHGEKNPLSGEIQANFVLIPKEQAELVVSLAPNELVKLTG